jgi:hypothetical protein
MRIDQRVEHVRDEEGKEHRRQHPAQGVEQPAHGERNAEPEYPTGNLVTLRHMRVLPQASGLPLEAIRRDAKPPAE